MTVLIPRRARVAGIGRGGDRPSPEYPTPVPPYPRRDSYFPGSSTVTSSIRHKILVSHDHGTRLQIAMKTDGQFDRILKMLEENKQGLVEIKTTMMEMRATKEEFEIWKPAVDKSVFDL